METAGTPSLLSLFALSDPLHFLSAVFWLRVNVVNAFRKTQRAVNVQRKDILGDAILMEGAGNSSTLPAQRPPGLSSYDGVSGQSMGGPGTSRARSVCWRPAMLFVSARCTLRKP